MVLCASVWRLAGFLLFEWCLPDCLSEHHSLSNRFCQSLRWDSLMIPVALVGLQKGYPAGNTWRSVGTRTFGHGNNQKWLVEKSPELHVNILKLRKSSVGPHRSKFEWNVLSLKEDTLHVYLSWASNAWRGIKVVLTIFELLGKKKIFDTFSHKRPLFPWSSLTTTENVIQETSSCANNFSVCLCMRVFACVNKSPSLMLTGTMVSLQLFLQLSHSVLCNMTARVYCASSAQTRSCSSEEHKCIRATLQQNTQQFPQLPPAEAGRSLIGS